MSKITIQSVFIILALIVFILFVIYYFEIDEDSQISLKTRTLANDGFCVLYSPYYSSQTITKPCPKLQSDALAKLPNGYEFVDYIYKINNVALSTFHRDVTSSQHNYGTQYPVYTMILYKYQGDLLSLCPGSNLSYPFNWSHIVNVQGEPGTVFLFNSDLLHAGCTNMCKEREVIQYKIAHKDDLPRLEHLDGIRNEKTDVCKITYYNMIMQKLSYYFEMPINYFFYPLMVKRNADNTILGKIQSFIPIEYYNNA